MSVPGEPTRGLNPRCSLSHCLLVIEPTFCFLSPRRGHTSFQPDRNKELKGDLGDPAAATMSSENLGDRSGRQLPLFWPVPTCDPELRVVPPGRVNLQRNQEPRRGWISILEPLRGATWSSPNRSVSTEPLSQPSPWGAAC